MKKYNPYSENYFDRINYKIDLLSSLEDNIYEEAKDNQVSLLDQREISNHTKIGTIEIIVYKILNIRTSSYLKNNNGEDRYFLIAIDAENFLKELLEKASKVLGEEITSAGFEIRQDIVKKNNLYIKNQDFS